MRRKLAAVLVSGLVGATSPAWAIDWFGADAGYVQPLGRTGDFTSNGTSLELRWRHHNRGRSAWELVAGYAQLGLEGEIQNTIAFYERQMREKNQLAQLQGQRGEGFLTATYGVLDVFYGGANFLFQPWKNATLAPFASFGGGLYNWRVPFTIHWYRSPFFGEQRSWDPPGTGGLYAGEISEDVVDYTKHKTSGGLNVALGSTVRVTKRIHLDLQARTHLIFSSGKGDPEEAIDDQDYLDRLSLILLHGGLNFRF